MKIDDLKGKKLKCIKMCSGFEINYPDLKPIEAVPIFEGKFINVIDMVDTHIIAKGVPLYGTFKVNKNNLSEHFVIADTDEQIS